MKEYCESCGLNLYDCICEQEEEESGDDYERIIDVDVDDFIFNNINDENDSLDDIEDFLDNN